MFSDSDIYSDKNNSMDFGSTVSCLSLGGLAPSWPPGGAVTPDSLLFPADFYFEGQLSSRRARRLYVAASLNVEISNVGGGWEGSALGGGAGEPGGGTAAQGNRAPAAPGPKPRGPGSCPGAAGELRCGCTTRYVRLQNSPTFSQETVSPPSMAALC